MLRRSCKRTCAAALLACSLVGAQRAHGQDNQAAARASTSRTLREYLFLDAQLGFRHRNVLYAEDAAPGPGGRSEFRLFLNGRAQNTQGGPLGVYIGLGGIGRLPSDTPGDPLLDAYDGFSAARNIRVYGAYFEYDSKDDEGQRRFTVRAGRLSDFDQREQLLLFDGAMGQVFFGRGVYLTAYGGRRAVLDGPFANDRTDLAAQLVGGGALTIRSGALGIRLGHRYEEIQRTQLHLDWSPLGERLDQLLLQLDAEALFGATAALEGDALLSGTDDSERFATRVQLSLDYRSASGVAALYAAGGVLIGRDPRPFGRGGTGPTPEEISAASLVSLSAAKLDRLFFGSAQPHAWAEAIGEYWLFESLALQAGTFIRIPFGDEQLRSLRPQLIEVWGGPELLLPKGRRIGLEARYALQDPGTPGRIFTNVGDGERTWGWLRFHAELPFRLTELLSLALRPEVSGFFWTTEGPLSQTSNQLGASGGMIAALRWSNDLRLAVRYNTGALPSYGSDEVRLIHDIEVWLGGSY